MKDTSDKVLTPMKRIWTVKHDGSNKTWAFDSYTAAIESVKLTWPESCSNPNYLFPSESQTGDNTRIGFTPMRGDWVQINAMMIYTQASRLELAS